MTWQLIAAVAGSGLYGLLYVFAGFAGLRNHKLEPVMNMLLALSGAFVAISAVLTYFKASNGPFVLAAGLAVIHWITFRNGMRLHGNVTRSHHLVRLAISLVLLGLAVWALY